MKLFVDNLLYHLASEWKDTLLFGTSLNDNKRKRSEVEDKIQRIEDEMITVMGMNVSEVEEKICSKKKREVRYSTSTDVYRSGEW